MVLGRINDGGGDTVLGVAKYIPFGILSSLDFGWAVMGGFSRNGLIFLPMMGSRGAWQCICLKLCFQMDSSQDGCRKKAAAAWLLWGKFRLRWRVRIIQRQKGSKR